MTSTRTISVIESCESQMHIASEHAIIALHDIESSLLKAASEKFQADCLRITKNRQDAKTMLQDILLEQLSVALACETSDEEAKNACADFSEEIDFIKFAFTDLRSIENFVATRKARRAEQKDLVTLVRGNMVPHTGKKRIR